jgi:hypothetical protein
MTNHSFDIIQLWWRCRRLFGKFRWCRVIFGRRRKCIGKVEQWILGCSNHFRVVVAGTLLTIIGGGVFVL